MSLYAGQRFFVPQICFLAALVFGTATAWSGGNSGPSFTQNIEPPPFGSINIQAAPYSAKADRLDLTDGVIAAGSTAFSSATAAFTQADVGKMIRVVGADVAGADLITTIAGITNLHAVTLGAPAVIATPTVGIASCLIVTPQTGGGSYAPGDLLFPVGGSVVTAPASCKANTTKLVAATVNAAGSGGTNGACVLTGTTGATVAGAVRFSIAATIAGNSISALGAISAAGNYYANPPSLSAEPVTSNCGLTGATLTLSMGANLLTTVKAGVYQARPTNPAATTTSGSGTGATVSLTSRFAGGLFSYGTDNTAVFNAAIATAQANVTRNGPNTVFFPAGDYMVSGAITPVYTGTSFPAQKPVRLTGAGMNANGYLNGTLAAATTIDSTYAGTDGINIAKIDTRGAGILEIDHLGLVDKGTDNFLFLFTTNTSLKIHDVSFSGNPECYGTNCAQQAIQLGTSVNTTTIQTNASTAGFQGYGTSIADNYFDHIETAVAFGSAANSVWLSNNTVSASCGSSSATGAPYQFQGVGFGAAGNTLYGGISEIGNYPYGVALTVNGATNVTNLFDGIGFWDEVPGQPTLAFAYASTGSSSNSFILTGHIGTTISGAGISGAGGQFNKIVAPGGFGATLASIDRAAIHDTSTVASYFVAHAFGVGNANPLFTMDVGDGTYFATQRLNGNLTTGAAYYLTHNSNTVDTFLGDYSVLFGGAFNRTTLLGGFYGLDFATGNTLAGTIDTTGHWSPGRVTAPVISAGACGPGANGALAASSNDQSGEIIIGGADTAMCAVTFANAFAIAPRACVFSPSNSTAAASGATAPYISAVSTTGFALTGSSLSSTRWYYHCY